ncbi:hypothetical protein GGR56DRAFT_592905 [Xylariaceae sp. FL0804]|nr:hypothetical protein GGR56DRAFT_592905 [Xylariaceae sp. FL0804]
MYLRLQSEEHLPAPKERAIKAGQGYLQSRLLIDADEDGKTAARSPPPKKKRTYYSVAPLLEKHKAIRPGNHDEKPLHRLQRLRHQPLASSPVPEPESPIIVELADKFNALGGALEDRAVARLAETEQALHGTLMAAMRAELAELSTLRNASEHLLRPLAASRVDWEEEHDETTTITSPLEDKQRNSNEGSSGGGASARRRQRSATMRDALAAFESRLDEAAAELDGAWAA